MTSLQQWAALIALGYRPAMAAVLVNSGAAVAIIREQKRRG